MDFRVPCIFTLYSVIIHYYFILLPKLPSHWELFHPAPLTYLQDAVSCCLPLPGPRSCWGLILPPTRCPSPRISHSSKEPWGSFYWQMALEPKIWLPGMLLVPGVSLLLGLLTDKREEIYGCILTTNPLHIHVYVYICIHTHPVYIYTPICNHLSLH